MAISRIFIPILAFLVGLCDASDTVTYVAPPPGAFAEFTPGFTLNSGPKPEPEDEDEIGDEISNNSEGNEDQSRKKRQTSCNGKYSQTDRNAILKFHNDMRSTIARGRYVARGITKPPAVNMRKLYWSCALENSAQQVASGCVFQHSNRQGKNIGENLYQYRIQSRWSPNPLPINGTGYDACKAWENEFPTIGWPTNVLSQNSFNTGIGHATQMAWWQTTMIGCGAAQCSDSTYQKLLVVCHYRDANIIIMNICAGTGLTRTFMILDRLVPNVEAATDANRLLDYVPFSFCSGLINDQLFSICRE
ncbi:SCP-like protein [Necator americanus]|uniref:SCP-like protein n=1 Tax=Necator americanus TaxID=51031 RepID=W2SZY9_NECAM|nr:SCP-like protein [Necator americanus]ETN75218.1 SCP-like protein [Necator americanus]